MYDFTEPFRNPGGSPIRELFKYLGEPGMISLAGGYPASDLFDTEGLQRAAAAAWTQPALCLQYGPTDGLPVLKDALAQLMQQRGVSVPADQLMVTTGSQQGFDLLLRVLVAPGDAVLTEQPAYPATLQALKMQQARIVTVPVDAQGLDVARLAAMLESGEAGRPKLLYTVPTFANPTGATLSLERRRALVELAVKYGFIIVEDEPYADLRFAGEALPSLLKVAQDIDGGRERVVYFGSLSKVVAPGIRVGWTVAPADIVRRCTVAKQTADLCSAPWMQAIAAAYLAQGALTEHLPRIAEQYRRKCEALCDALDAQLAGALQFQRPEGGMFVWARMDGVDSSELLKHAIAQKVLFVPGKAFYADHIDAAAFRLSFAAPGIGEIGEAAARLARARKALLGESQS
ncbi:PLP-dependent aminotransferase family protein [Caballeronia sp. LZ035]|uniref:aminotransferase-like domain-containing protein n=1 Tax=Caballeronia sp. LZ035 TaxID=3038568 RepID=UPI00285A5E9D|nr:PLP-dependent aminotransferase family protein [Caballeronia sp. LZ035]MDR5763349.1 PLP-dependent aminotransferase family protein [Caballeronia sp. LZ035]